MRSNIAIALAAGIFLTAAAVAPGGPRYPMEATVTAIPGVVAAGAKWEIVWSGLEDADGFIATPDGGMLFTQQTPHRIRKLKPDGTTEILYENLGVVGTLAFDPQGRLFASNRPPAPGVWEISPQRRLLVNSTDGEPFPSVGDMVADSKGGLYFNESRRMPTPRAHYLARDGKLLTFGDGVQINGMILSPDEKTLYVTNRDKLTAFDIRADGMGVNQRQFAQLQGTGVAGDGMAIDDAGRLYVTTQIGVQVVSPQGQVLGVIPTPRNTISVAFAGPGKKVLYVSGGGMVDAAGVEHRETAEQPAATIYRLPMLAEGIKSRPK